jgi:chromosome segregation ATPase
MNKQTGTSRILPKKLLRQSLLIIVVGLINGYTLNAIAMDVVAKVAAPNVEKSLDGSVQELAEAEFNEENIETEIFENESIAQDAVKEKIRLINETKKADHALNKTQQKLSQSKRASQHAQNQLNKTQSKYDKLVKKHNLKVDELKRLDDKIKQQNQNLSVAESQLGELQSIHARLNDSLADAKELTAELKQRKSYAERQIAFQRQKNKSLQAQIKRLQGENRRLGSKVTKLENQSR